MSDIDPAVMSSEIVQSMSAKIAADVAEIRRMEEFITRARDEHGIANSEETIAFVRAELLDLVREYHDLTGINWMDSETRVAYVQAGESNRFDTSKVDQVLSALLALQGDMDKLLVDVPLKFPVKLEAELVTAGTHDLSASVFSKSDVLEVLAISEKTRLEQAQALRILVMAMAIQLQLLASSRKVTATKEHIAIQKLGGSNGEA